MEIDKYYRYKKPRYVITLDTDVDYEVNLGNSFGSFSAGNVGIYILFTPHKNIITLQRDDCDENVYVNSEKLMSKYEPIIDALFHKKQNDNVSSFVNTSIKYLKLEAENRDIKIKSIQSESK